MWWIDIIFSWRRRVNFTPSFIHSVPEIPINPALTRYELSKSFTSCADSATLSLSSHHCNSSTWGLFHKITGSPQVFSSVIGWKDTGCEWGHMWNGPVIESYYLSFCLAVILCLIYSFLKLTNLFIIYFCSYSFLSHHCQTLSFIWPYFFHIAVDSMILFFISHSMFLFVPRKGIGLPPFTCYIWQKPCWRHQTWVKIAEENSL